MSENTHTEFGEKLANAINAKNNDINQMVWKTKEGEEIRLMDMDAAYLQTVYNHCISMLFNTDKGTPGKYQIKKNIKTFINHCNAELLKRFLLYESNIPFLKTPLDLVRAINEFKKAKSLRETDTVDNMFEHLPVEYESVTFEDLIAACLDRLEIINRNMISENFILSQGVWLTDSEKEELNEKDSSKSWLDIVKEKLMIPNARLRTNSKGFSYNELRLLIHLPISPKITSLPTETLKLFRDKVFLLLDINTDFFIKKWETIKSNIEKVADYKHFMLKVKHFNEN